MGRRRLYATDAERQAACRVRKAQSRLNQTPQVYGEGYTLYQGDALQVVPLLGAFDHCITDPPYESHAHVAGRRTRDTLQGTGPYVPLSFAPITEAQRAWLTTRSCRWLLIFCQAEAVGRYAHLLGKRYKRAMIWRKRDGTPQYSGDRPGMGYESIVAAWCQRGHPHWFGGGKHGVYDHPIRDGEERVHETQKPLPLLRELLQDFTAPGDIIYDPFMGSGSLGIACIQMGRRYLGVELDPAMFAIACRRTQAALAQGQLFPEARPTQQVRLL